MDIFFTAIRVVLSLTDAYLFYLFHRMFDSVRPRWHRQRVGGGFLLFLPFPANLAMHLFHSAWWQLLLSVLVVYLALLALFQGGWRRRLRLQVLYSLHLAALYRLLCRSMPFHGHSLKLLLSTQELLHGEHFLCILLVYKMRFLCCIIVFCHRSPHPAFLRHRGPVLLCASSLLTVLLCCLIPSGTLVLQTARGKVILFLVLILFLLIQVTLTHLFVELNRSLIDCWRLRSTDTLQRQAVQMALEQEQGLRRTIHDVRRHYLYLYDRLRQGEVDKALRYLRSLDQSLTGMDTAGSPRTGNADFDYVLGAKSREAVSGGIVLEVRGALPETIFVDPVDINILLGNALDNAIQACGTGNGGIVRVSFGCHRHLLTIRISNPYTGSLRPLGHGCFRSTKGPHRGQGLEIIHWVAGKYGGQVQVRTDGKIFVLDILLQESRS